LSGTLADPEGLLDHATVVYEPSEPDKKVEPFYFDARRGASATALDIGFMPDALSMTALAFPAVEFLCLVGLQRFRPTQVKVRVFDYATWAQPLDARVAPLAAAGLLGLPGARTYRFEVEFRTDQRKHKAFTPATPL
jgi:CRISPR-associated protein Csx14